MIRSTAEFYLKHQTLNLDNQTGYKRVCLTLLKKYPALNKNVIKYCNIENARRSSKTRALQTYVKIFFFNFLNLTNYDQNDSP